MNLQIDGYMRDLKIIRTNMIILCCKYSKDRKMWAAGFINGCINLYSSKTENLEISLMDNDTHNVNNAVTGLSDQKNIKTNTLFASYSGGLIKKWNCETQKCIYTIREKRQTLGIACHPKIEKLFSLGDEGKIFMYDEETQRHQQSYAPSETHTNDGHSSRIFSICFNPANPNEFITGGWDTTVHFWDIRQKNSVRHVNDIYIGGDGLAINKQGTEFLSFAWRRDNPIQLWNYSTGELIKNITPDTHMGQLYCGKYINEKFVAAGGCDSNVFRVIDMSSHTTATSVAGLPGGVYSVDFKTPPPGAKTSHLQKIDDVTELPNVLFCSAKNLYEIRFK